MMITIVVIIISLLVTKLLLKLSGGWDRSSTCLLGKTTIVTGANTGIGFYTAQDFAKRGARVILACKNQIRANEAKDKIIEATGNPNVVVRIVDLASLASVRRFAKGINKTETRLDILVNNAGISHVKDSLTEDGLNLLMQVNHFGPFLLTHLLIDLLKRSAPSRIVNLTSFAAWLANLNPDNLNAFQNTLFFSKDRGYANTKLCNLLFTNELARRLEDSGIVANSVHPGAVVTEIRRHIVGIPKIFLRLSTFFFKTSEEGAQTSIYVSVSKDLAGVSGEYFDNCRLAWFPPMPRAARNKDLAEKVWDESEKFVKLASAESIPGHSINL